MGFRYRKSVSFGPVRINFSKSGIGYSIGTKGVRITKKANGGERATLSIPGTGISYVLDNKQEKKKTMNNDTSESKIEEMPFSITSITASVNEYDVSNIFNKFELSDKEILLLSFISKHYEQLNNEFSIHDISALGYITTATYYNNLYDKALLLKPAKGKYAFNTSLINKLANEEIERQKQLEEIERQKQKQKEEKEKIQKQKIKKIAAYIAKFIMVPLYIIGPVLYAEDYIEAIAMWLFALLCWNFQHNYFKKNKTK